MTEKTTTLSWQFYRLIPSKYPPIGAFDTVSTPADLQAVMDLVGWTNDRLLEHRLNRLPRSEWVYGVPNASIVMASFLHCGVDGMRFNGGELGAWYASASVNTAIVEVAHHLRRDAANAGKGGEVRDYRAYSCTLKGGYADIRGAQARMGDVYASDSYAASQLYGENVREAGGAGLVYDSVRHAGGVNVVAFTPTNIADVTQTDHYRVAVNVASQRIEVTRLCL